jgi:DNA-binding NtrC family response regulator
MDFIEKEHIIHVLKHFNGVQRQTAIAIGWALNTLKSKMEKYGIESSRYEADS